MTEFEIRQVNDLISVSRDANLTLSRLASDNVARARELLVTAAGTPHAGAAALEVKRAVDAADASAFLNRKRFSVVR